MISYETCKACHGREAFDLGPCNKCSHKSASVSIPKEENKKPAWIRIHEYLCGV